MRAPLIALSLTLCACAASPPSHRPGAAPQATAGAAADDNLNAVAWTQASVEHDLVYREVFRVATERLDAALADRRWDALADADRTTPLDGLPPAVVLDVDETVLDNSPYQARLVRAGAAFDEATWDAWCREAKARALPGAVEFTQAAAKRGVRVFYVSNRAQHLDAATLANLRADGFPVDGDSSFLGLGTLLPGCEAVGTEKGCRRQLVGRSHRVLMQFGDQVGDFVDVLANTPQGRRDAVAPYADWIGSRWFVLPNPTYGAWEPALFDNDWTQPAAARRQAKRDALRVD